MINLTIYDMRLTDGLHTRAFCDILFNGLLVKGLRVVQGREGLFVAYPEEKGRKDNKYYPTVKPMSQKLKETIEEAVLKHYERLKKGELT